MKRLRLSKDTLLSLDENALQHLMGGGALPPGAVVADSHVCTLDTVKECASKGVCSTEKDCTSPAQGCKPITPHSTTTIP